MPGRSALFVATYLIMAIAVLFVIPDNHLYAQPSEENKALERAKKMENEAIALVKDVSVSILDASLPEQPFIHWFAAIVGEKTAIQWELNDCGEQTGTPADIGRDFPACVGVNASLPDGRKVYVMITVGTFKKGIFGQPDIWDIAIERNGRFSTVKKLSDLPGIAKSK